MDFLKRLFAESDSEKIKRLLDAAERIKLPEVPGLEDRLSRMNLKLNSAGFDRWGLHPATIVKVAPIFYQIYKTYFRVETVGMNKVPAGKAIFIGNHGGQLPVDAFLSGMAIMLESEPPTLVRAMIERWVPTVPFVSGFFTRIGAIIGDPENCRDLLQHNQSVMVFPEGVRGSGKLFKERYQLQRFGTGFMRLALEAGAPIVPVAIIGAEESYPGLFNFKWLAKLLRAPYFPITPFFPLLGPLGALPLPTKVTIRIGDPIYFQGTGDETDDDIKEKVQQVKDALASEIRLGLEERGSDIFGTGVHRS